MLKIETLPKMLLHLNICQKISPVSEKKSMNAVYIGRHCWYNKTHPIFTGFFNLGLTENPKVVIFINISTDSIKSKAF